MSIPLDRLYHFIDQTAREIYGEPVLIYRFWPHGSKNINDLNPTSRHSWTKTKIAPYVWCNDQEPLSYEFYSQQNSQDLDHEWGGLMKSLGQFDAPKNLIDTAIYKNEILQKLFGNSWVHIFCLDPLTSRIYSLRRDLTWQEYP